MANGGRLMGKSTVITGANQGIGRAIALAFAAQGADLFLTDIKTERLEELAQAARRHGIEADWRQADVTRAGEIDATMAAAEARNHRQADTAPASIPESRGAGARKAALNTAQ